MQQRNLYNAGYYPQYLWEQRRQLAEKAGFDLLHLARSLSTFHISTLYRPRSSIQEPHPQEARIAAVLGDLLGRGLPTLPSLFVERALMAECIKAGLAREADVGGAIRFLPPQERTLAFEEWRDALVRAHVAVDPRLRPRDMDASVLESQQETDFFHSVLPLAVGPGLWQFFEPQRPFPELLPPADAAKHPDERVDLAVRVPGLQAIVEVDGSQHLVPPQSNADRRRDADLHARGWSVARVQTSEIHTSKTQAQLSALAPDSPFVRIVRRNCAEPLWSKPMESYALRLVLAPFGIARVQRALLLALGSSILSLKQQLWRITVLERDVPCTLLALVDFCEQLSAIYSLLKLDRKPPQIEVTLYTTAEFFNLDGAVTVGTLRQHGIQVQEFTHGASTFDGDRSADLLLDVAVLQRNGYNHINGSFVDAHLSATGAAYEIRSAYDYQDVRRLAPGEPFAYPVDDDSRPALRYWLQNIFRKDNFREGQFEILRRSLALQPVIGLLPTGAGKSLCYQLSALLQPGMTIVIDPIVSLMVDQVDNLQNVLAIDWIDSIHSWRDAEAKNTVTQAVAEGCVKILFVSPERLQSRKFRDKLAEFSLAYPVPYGVIDEAHCVSEWGHDFRTSYLRLATTLREHARHRGQEPIVLALTGTASYAVLSDVQREIGVEDENAQVYPSSFDRKELHFRVLQTPSRQKQQELCALMLQTLPEHFSQANWQTLYGQWGDATKAGIIFTPHANGKYGANSLGTLLSQRLAAQVGSFTGKDSKDSRVQAQAGFKNNDFALLVATKAFGMGIDKPNIRYTIHYNIPGSLEAFYQEAGRAGRDRNPAVCWLLFSDDCPEQANRALEPNAGNGVVAAAGGNPDGGDVHRLLWLHQNTYCGLDTELAQIRDVYQTFVGAALRDQPPGKVVALTIPFGGDNDDKDNRQVRDKALYRLRILGIVGDYTLDYNASIFEVTAAAQTDAQLIANLQQYVGRYKVREVVDAIPTQIQREPGTTVLGKCSAYLLRFVYEEIEKKRRAAIRSMAEVARKAALLQDPEQQDLYVRGELRAYLEKSPFTDVLLALAKQVEPNEWLRVLDLRDVNGVRLLSTVDGVRQLVGGCRRTLESYLEHPGLLFLSSAGRLLMPEPDLALAEAEQRRAIRALAAHSPQQREAIVAQMLIGYMSALANVPGGNALYDQVASVALEESPSRSLARRIWPAAMPHVQRILINLTLQDVRAVNERLHAESGEEWWEQSF